MGGGAERLKTRGGGAGGLKTRGGGAGGVKIRGGGARAEMEKDAPNERAACANFAQL